MPVVKPSVNQLKDLSDVDDSLAPTEYQTLNYDDVSSELENLNE